METQWMGPVWENVSRETKERLSEFAALLLKWNARINLIGSSTQESLWQRHMEDSAQLWPYMDADTVLMDIGSGGGFPAIVLSILGAREVHLVESDERKALFLQQAAKISPGKVVIHQIRVEELTPFPVSCITARAVAPVTQILEWTRKWQCYQPTYLLLKGEQYRQELQIAAKQWQFESNDFASYSSEKGRIIRLRQVSKQ